ncbi:hypothetical protein GCM10009549_24150 [Streptomyces thermoalcalitolerans]|uniref:Uncharacterized protein n=1 Tax=Streptomyces thermoalcalitolerans TaxID=65605 RepID=A0ABP3Z341_9ACTN
MRAAAAAPVVARPVTARVRRRAKRLVRVIAVMRKKLSGGGQVVGCRPRSVAVAYGAGPVLRGLGGRGRRDPPVRRVAGATTAWLAAGGTGRKDVTYYPTTEKCLKYIAMGIFFAVRGGLASTALVRK